MKLKNLLVVALAAISVAAGAQSLSPSTKWHWDKVLSLWKPLSALQVSSTFWV